MNKLLITLIATITFAPYIACMEKNTLAEAGLSVVAQKVYSYIPVKEPKSAQKITSSISQLNKTLYKNMSDAIVARKIITYFAKDFNFNCFSVEIAEKFTFPGAKVCLALSNQLYDKDLTPEKVKQLFNEGAILDYLSYLPEKRQYPVLYWSQIDQDNPKVSKAIVKELLDLGADPEVCNLLEYVVDTDLDLTQLVLGYKAKINTHVWASALLAKNQEKILPLLIEHATQDELNTGLIACFKLWFNDKDTDYKPEVMQQLIDNKANPSVAILALMSILPKLTCPIDDSHLFVKNFKFLCNNNAFDQKALNQIRSVHNLFGSMVNAMEKNQPSDPFWDL